MKTACLLACALAASLSGSLKAQDPTWSNKAAAEYLDSRIEWWITWPPAARDHDTFCVSCHTVLPYAMGRPALRAPLGEHGPSPTESKLIDNVAKRVRLWNEVEPFYPDAKRGVPKTAESRGSEAIMDAVILSGYAGASGKLNADAKLALDNMWALQLKTGDAAGAWDWLQFHNSPWEGDSQYFGAAMAAIATGNAPGNYAASPELQAGVKLLRGYLLRNRDAEIPLNRVMLLWASAKVPGILTPAEQKSIVDEALAKQQPDGGFSLTAFVGSWKRHDGTPLETASDGYATGLVTFVLQQAGVPRSRPELRRGLDWLAAHQEKTDGRWIAYSLNKQRDLSTDVGRFMADAATAYAVMALDGTR